MKLKWNLVTRNLHGHELLQKKLRQKITKLERYLEHFPPDAVHLHIALERHPTQEQHKAALTLRVPSNILHSEKSAPDLIRAFDEANKALLRELESLKSQLRRERFWKRKPHRNALAAAGDTRFEEQPQAEGTGPQNLSDVIRELLEANYSRLLRYVRRQLWHDVTAGDVPGDAIDPRAVVDEVARRALAEPHRKPEEMSFLLWLYVLARRELARRRRALKTQAEEMVALETPRFIPDELAVVEGYDAEQPLDIIERQLKPSVVQARDVLSDPQAVSPDHVAARQDLLAEMRRLAARWPTPEREAFELYFVEGFEPEEMAMILGQTVPRVRETIELLHQKLRTEALRQALV